MLCWVSLWLCHDVIVEPPWPDQHPAQHSMLPDDFSKLHCNTCAAYDLDRHLVLHTALLLHGLVAVL